jgi:transposase
VFSKEFKLHVLKEVRSGKTQAAVARQYQILPKIISRWLNEQETYAGEAFAGRGNSYTETARMGALERENARLRMEKELLKKALRCLEALPRLESGNGGGA